MRDGAKPATFRGQDVGTGYVFCGKLDLKPRRRGEGLINGGASRDGAMKTAERSAPPVGEREGSPLLGERGKGREGPRMWS